jgi:T5SS/PEP-CTERM-associated repeat protein
MAAILAALCLAGPLPTLHAAIVINGDVDPADPADWNSSTDGCVGITGNGDVTVDSDSDLESYNGYIGYDTGSTGEVTVDGVGSTWTNSSYLYVGLDGDGTLNITGGGAVNSGSSSGACHCYIGYSSGSTGEVTVNGTGSMWDNNSYLYVGHKGAGTLNITDGGTVNSSGTWCIGFKSGSTGEVTVDGAGSMWTNDSSLYVGLGGDGTLNITDGGAVSNNDGFICAKGVVTVDGTGSTWTNRWDDLYVGAPDSGTLNITDGGAVTAPSVSIGSLSLLAIDVGNDSALIVGGGSGTIDNDGTVRVMAGTGSAMGTAYSPISAGTWSGGGTYQAIGGTWNETEHEFTVSGVQSGTSGTMATIDLANTQRLSIADGGTGWSVGASFLAKTGDHTELNFTATAITGETRTDLEDLLEPGQWVEGAWEFIVAGDGYTTGDPVYLSVDVGADFLRSDLQVWHYDGTDWDAYAAGDLTYDGQYASFTVRGFSGYAVTAVPEPGTLISLLIGAATLAIFARRRG